MNIIVFTCYYYKETKKQHPKTHSEREMKMKMIVIHSNHYHHTDERVEEGRDESESEKEEGEKEEGEKREMKGRRGEERRGGK